MGGANRHISIACLIRARRIGACSVSSLSSLPTSFATEKHWVSHASKFASVSKVRRRDRRRHECGGVHSAACLRWPSASAAFEDHRINIGNFGKGQAKKLVEFVLEVVAASYPDVATEREGVGLTPRNSWWVRGQPQGAFPIRLARVSWGTSGSVGSLLCCSGRPLRSSHIL